MQLKAAYLEDLFAIFASSGGWNFKPYIAADGSPYFLGASIEQPVVIIRASDGAMFRCTKPFGVRTEAWWPDYGRCRPLQ